MTPREEGFLLLTCQLGDPNRKVLTTPQLRNLFRSMEGFSLPEEARELEEKDLGALGCSKEISRRILELLGRTQQLGWYLKQAKMHGCTPITRVSPGYPLLLRKRLGLESPGCLWAKGDVSLLDSPAVALVGSRSIEAENLAFAQEVGRQAARQGYTLVSGNAKGADQAAQESCLEAGGRVISVVADTLTDKVCREGLLYLSLDSFDTPFSPARALHRNRVIHALGQLTFVAQCSQGTGGTWDGTVTNLRQSLSPVFCFQDGTAATEALQSMGAWGISREDLMDFSRLTPGQWNFLQE